MFNNHPVMLVDSAKTVSQVPLFQKSARQTVKTSKPRKKNQQPQAPGPTLKAKPSTYRTYSIPTCLRTGGESCMHLLEEVDRRAPVKKKKATSLLCFFSAHHPLEKEKAGDCGWYFFLMFVLLKAGHPV